jgi:hypothetical protein
MRVVFEHCPSLSQVSLRFFNVVLYGVQLFPGCNLASMIQRGFKALDPKCSTSGKGISLLLLRHWLTWRLRPFTVLPVS